MRALKLNPLAPDNEWRSKAAPRQRACSVCFRLIRWEPALCWDCLRNWRTGTTKHAHRRR